MVMFVKKAVVVGGRPYNDSTSGGCGGRRRAAVVVERYPPRPLFPPPSEVVVVGRRSSSGGPSPCTPTPPRSFVKQAVVIETYRSRLIPFERIDRRGYVVLVAGEASGHHAANKSFLGAHVSMGPVGVAFEQLLPIMGRDRIIVIAQLNECRAWMDDMVAKNPTNELWARKRAAFLDNCAALIKSGGADYDGVDVNPDTVYRVLRGEKDKSGRRVVDTSQPGQRIFLAIYSHGSKVASSHIESSVDGALNPASIDPTNELWFSYLPYENSPKWTPLSKTRPFPRLDGTGRKALDEIPRDYVRSGTAPSSLLHWQHMVELYKYLFEKKSVSNILVFNHFCHSGGHSLFLDSPHYQRELGVHRWPLQIIHTAGPYQGGLGDLWFLTFNNLTDPRNASKNLGSVMTKAIADYWRFNSAAAESNSWYEGESREHYGIGEPGLSVGSQEEARKTTVADVLGATMADLSRCTFDFKAKSEFSSWSKVPRKGK